MAAETTELPLRVVVDHPVPGVALAVQNGKGSAFTLIPPAHASAKAIVFEIAVTAAVAPDGGVRLAGPIVQGPPAARFVYVSIGRYAGQADSPWARRAKIPLSGITAARIAALKPGQRLEGRVHGRDRKGEPACASVKLTGEWTVKG